MKNRKIVFFTILEIFKGRFYEKNNRGPKFDGKAKPTLEIRMEPKISQKIDKTVLGSYVRVLDTKHETRDLGELGDRDSTL